MPISFANPQYLALLLLVPLVVVLGRRSLAGLDRTRRRLALTVRSLLIILVVLALAEVQWRDDKDVLEVALLLDRSKSIPEDLRAKALAVVNEARRHMSAKNDKARLVVFGKDAAVEGELSVDDGPVRQIQSIVGPDQTNLAEGLDYALNSFNAAHKKRIVLISDGNETTGVALKSVELAREKGVVVDVVPLTFDLKEEVFVEKVVLPNEVRVGQPYEVKVVVRSLAKTNATLELFEDGRVVAQRKLELEPGTRVETFARSLDKTGFFTVRALLRAGDGSVASGAGRGDTIYQNNQAFGFVYVRGESKVLFVHANGGEGTETLKTALSLERVNFEELPAAEVPKDESLLQQYDAILLDNVPKYDLTLAQQQAIERSVKNQGLGLVMIGGPDSFGAGGWEDEPPERTPIEKALPVLMEPKQKSIIPTGALAIIMHSCEFPNGNDMGRKVTMKAIETLSSKDYIGVIQYSMAGCEWTIKMQQAKQKRRLIAKVKGMNPGDMPDFDPSMKMAVSGLQKAKASLKHMIILSDGDPSQPTPNLLKTCRDEKITISTIAIMPHGGARGSEVQLMKRIADSTGGKFYYLKSPQSLPKIFIKETKRVARPLLRNIEFVPRKVAASAIIKGFRDFPALGGHVLASPKKFATTVLETPEKDPQPVLVHWRYGAGKSVAFTSDASPRWAGKWIGWQGYSAFWGQLVRWVSKEVKDANFEVSTKVSGSRGKIAVDAVDEDGNFINALNVEGKVTTPDGREVSVRLRQVGPGRYEGDFEVGEVGNYTISLLSKSKDGAVSSAFTSGLVFPYSEEYKRTRSNDLLLGQIAETTRGRIVPLDKALAGDAGFFNHTLAGQDSLVAQWPFLFLLALVLFPIDVFIRRVMLDYGRMLGWVRRTFLGVAGESKEDAKGSTLDRLRQRKAALRGEQLQKYEVRDGVADEPIDGTRDPASAGATGQTPTSSGGGRAKPEEPAEKPAEFTSRLLAAKRRARKDNQSSSDDTSN